MLKQLIQFEALYQLKQRSFIFLSLSFFLYGFVITADNIGEGMELLNNNSPYRLGFFITLTSVSAILIASLFCVNTVLRDEEYRFDAITGFLSVKKRLFSRLIVALSSVIFIVSLITFGLLAGLLSPEIDQDKVAPLELFDYIKPWLIIVLPNVFISTVFLFAMSYLGKSALVTYLSAVALFIFFWIIHIYIGAPLQGNPVSAQPEILDFLALLDPFGATAFFEQTQFLTATDKNKVSLSFSGLLLCNRFIWLSIASLVLLRLIKILSKPNLLSSPTNLFVSFSNIFASFRFKQSTQSEDKNPGFESANKEKTQNIVNDYNAIKSTLNEAVTKPESKKYQWLVFFTMTQFEIRQMLIGWPFKIFIFIWCLLVATGIYMVATGSSAGEVSGRFPTTALLLNQCTEMLSLFSLLLVVYYCAEKICNERLLKISPLINVTPVNSSILIGAKLLALLFIPFILISVLILMAIFYQLISGYYQFELSHYFTGYYFFGLPIMIQTIFIVFVQTAFTRLNFSNKYPGLLVSGSLLIVFANLPNIIGLEHTLLQFNQFPDMSRVHTESVGYGLHAIHFSWYIALWGSLSFIFFRQTLRLWAPKPRSSQSSHNSNSNKLDKQKRLSLNNLSTILLTISCAGFVLVASLMLYQIHWKNSYKTSAENIDARENYERKYRQYQNLIVPQIIDVKTKVDIFPENNLVAIEGNYLLQNTSDQIINKLFISSNHPFKKLDINKTKAVLTDALWNIHLLDLTVPLLPGETLSMTYQLEISSSPFAIDNSILTNGTNIIQRQFEPTFGYKWSNEIQSTYERQKRGLPDKTEDNFKNTLHGGDPMLASEKSSFETIISTSKDQVAVASGELVKHWLENNRHYYFYKTDRKIFTPLVSYFSAAYEIKKVNYQGTDIEMYYYPNHARNIDEMIIAASAALDYGQRHFGEYIYPSLRILEVPGNVGKASAGIISMGQDLYVRDSNDGAKINTVARRTIHEVAHQWWGEKLNPEFGRGSGVLIESMAMYMQSAVLQELYGSAMPQALAKRNQRRYFSGRAYAHEVESSLSQSMFEQYLIYSKGSSVLFSLRDLLGEIKLDQALNQLIQQHKNGITANIDDLTEALYLVADENQQGLIDDWLNKIVEYDLSITNAEVKPLENGSFSVSFEVHASRLLTENKGKQSLIAIDEPIKIGLFDKNLSNKNAKAIYLKHHQINQPVSQFSFIVDSKPEYLIIDPQYTRLDQNLNDNVVKLGGFQ